MSEECKCPKCGETLNVSTVIHHLTVVEGWGLREASRWAALHVDVGFAGQGDGVGQTRATSSPATWIGE